MAKVSILDLAFVPEGKTPGDALRNSLDLAQHAEWWGYERFWLAEHHNMIGIASAATSVVMGYIAGGTSSIKVAAGGVMLPNHCPLVIAEQFGTLESLYPGRIELGLGRAPGTDMVTLRAMRRDPAAAERFPEDVVELQRFFAPAPDNALVQAVPGAGLDVPLWILGSSLFGARLAAELGLPYAFASHFAPAQLEQAMLMYRSGYQASDKHPRSYAAAGVNVVIAPTEEEARMHFTSIQQQFTRLVRGTPGRLPAPVESMDGIWTMAERAQASSMLRYAFVGTPEKVEAELKAFVERTRVDELIVASAMYHHRARLWSYEQLSKIATRL